MYQHIRHDIFDAVKLEPVNYYLRNDEDSNQTPQSYNDEYIPPEASYEEQDNSKDMVNYHIYKFTKIALYLNFAKLFLQI